MTTMNTPRAADLEAARRMQALARITWAQSTTKIGRRNAAEDVEFWGNKAAFLAAWIAKEG